MTLPACRRKVDRRSAAKGSFRTELKCAARTRDKNMVMLTFTHGKLAVRDFHLETPEGCDKNNFPVFLAIIPQNLMANPRLRKLFLTRSYGTRRVNRLPLSATSNSGR
jgi:hypothetical protein